MENNTNSSLTNQERLLLHQLQTANYWNNKTSSRNSFSADKLCIDSDSADVLPAKWSLTENIELHEWQKECVEKWLRNDRRGIAKVVTGGGKTIFALSLVQKLQNDICPNVKVLVVVPTIVLLNQWYDVLIKHSNIPPNFIGRLGGGFKNDISKCAILVAVSNSVVSNLVDKYKNSYSQNLFLIVDECHRVRGEVMQKVLEIKRAFSLGLSATPEQENKPIVYDEDEPLDNEQEDSGLEDVVVKELGEVFFELSYDEAIRQGFLPEFSIYHIGLPLTDDEKGPYEKVSNEITDIRKKLQEVPGAPASGGALTGWARKKAGESKTSEYIRSLCNAYVSKVAQRKDMLYKAKSRIEAVKRLISERLEKFPQTQIIMFHERIDEVMRLYECLREFDHITARAEDNFKDRIKFIISLLCLPKQKLPVYKQSFRVRTAIINLKTILDIRCAPKKKNRISVVPEHSELSESIRAQSIELFRSGVANVIVSGKALIEGFDAPAADVGISVASSSSQRQAIQSTGRILRKSKDNTSKSGLIYRFYITKTTDELIYKKVDFSKIAGAQRNRFFIWNPFDKRQKIEDIEVGNAPYTPLPIETEIDWTDIVPGTDIDLSYEGKEFQFDEKTGNVYQKSGREKDYVANPQNVIELIKQQLPNMPYNYFTQTQNKRILVRYAGEDGQWHTKYIGELNEILKFSKKTITSDFDWDSAEFGQVLPFTVSKLQTFRIILFHGLKYIQNNKKRNAKNSQQTQTIIENISRLGFQLSTEVKEISILNDKHVVYRFDGNLHYICTMSEDLIFN